LLLLVLGFIFFLITSGITLHIQGENAQQADTASTGNSGNRLDFIGQSIQVDFYSNFLQSEFENDVINFLMTAGPHTINPTKSFKDNMGSKLEGYLSDSARSIVSGDAGTVYAEAYSSIPNIQCDPQEIGGASASVNIRQTEGGVLELGGMSLGQRIKCDDIEIESSRTIDLAAGDYQLTTRAVLMHDKAVEAINSARLTMGGMEGTTKISNGWRHADDASVKSDILGGYTGWVAKVMTVGPLLGLSDTDGVYVEPFSISILNGQGRSFTSNDINNFVCYGEIGSVKDIGTNHGQTCRPDGLNLIIQGEKKVEDIGENEVVLDFEPPTPGDTATIEVKRASLGNVPITIEVPGLGKLIGSMIDTVYKGGMNKGYVTFSTKTHLCNAFKGKPNNAIIEGEVFEENQAYIPGNTEFISFKFISESQNIDSSTITNDIDCEDMTTEDMGENVVNMLTDGGRDVFEMDVIQTATNEYGITDQSKNALITTINKNKMLTSPGMGEQVTLSVSASVEDTTLGATTGTPPTTPPIPPDPQQNLDDLDNTDDGGEDPTPEQEKIREGTNARSLYDGLEGTVNFLNSASLASAISGQIDDSEALSKTAAVACKLMGLQNWMDMDDTTKALWALCSISRIGDAEEADKICTVAAVYQAIDSGNTQAIIAALMSMVNAEVDYTQFLITAEMIEQAIETGDPQDILAAVSTAARLAGETEIANQMASAAQLLAAIESGDMQMLMSAVLGMIDSDLANTLNQINNLVTAIENGDVEAVFSSIRGMAQSLGYEGLETALSTVGTVIGAVDMIMNLDDVLAECEGKIQWEWLCTLPQIGGEVCAKNLGTCTFDVATANFIDPEKLCNDIIFEMGFQIDCLCAYTCPTAPYVAYDTSTVGIDLTALRMLLDPDYYQQLLDNELERLRSMGLLMEYCKLDP